MTIPDYVYVKIFSKQGIKAPDTMVNSVCANTYISGYVNCNASF